MWFKRRDGKGKILMKGREKKIPLFGLVEREVKYLLFSLSYPFFVWLAKRRDFNMKIMYYYTLLNMVIRFKGNENIFRIKKNKIRWLSHHNLINLINFSSSPNPSIFGGKTKCHLKEIWTLYFPSFPIQKFKPNKRF